VYNSHIAWLLYHVFVGRMKIIFSIIVFFACANLQASCFQESAEKYKIHPKLLACIAKVESSFNPNAVGPALKGGNRAIGLMQINTIHLPYLESIGINRNNLYNACTSIDIGAYVFAQCRHDTGGATISALQCYNGGIKSKQHAKTALYAINVLDCFLSRFG
jgi:soluble lytic murein transglycosylase-like protein